LTLKQTFATHKKYGGVESKKNHERLKNTQQSQNTIGGDLNCNKNTKLLPKIGVV
jgi:hypothetical protein